MPNNVVHKIQEQQIVAASLEPSNPVARKPGRALAHYVAFTAGPFGRLSAADNHAALTARPGPGPGIWNPSPRGYINQPTRASWNLPPRPAASARVGPLRSLCTPVPKSPVKCLSVAVQISSDSETCTCDRHGDSDQAPQPGWPRHWHDHRVMPRPLAPGRRLVLPPSEWRPLPA